MKIENIPTEKFNQVLEAMLSQGWQQIYVYNGMDAGIDASEIHVRLGDVVIKFVWDNWSEGEISTEGEIAELRAFFR